MYIIVLSVCCIGTDSLSVNFVILYFISFLIIIKKDLSGMILFMKLISFNYFD
ncbi:hypothetical protein rpr22_CDSx350 [Rickettsia prowazekii str. Rp22]|uniref:Uncharacterized protein n=1 Tax=Rickettsia prowazekii (strain Rp22) TaxID=449216 RepID=D5AWR0_RICPP|nr:hypothetical protein rpr22_CDSx350 [Rickettsia prowazekii str. Rp22]